MAVDVGYIYHTDIHADVAYVRCFLAVDEAIAMAVAEMAVESVGIPNRYCRNAAVACEVSLTAVADCVD